METTLPPKIQIKPGQNQKQISQTEIVDNLYDAYLTDDPVKLLPKIKDPRKGLSLLETLLLNNIIAIRVNFKSPNLRVVTPKLTKDIRFKGILSGLAPFIRSDLNSIYLCTSNIDFIKRLPLTSMMMNRWKLQLVKKIVRSSSKVIITWDILRGNWLIIEPKYINTILGIEDVLTFHKNLPPTKVLQSILVQ